MPATSRSAPTSSASSVLALRPRAHGKYLGKGSLVFVQGKIRNTKYEKDGQTVYGTDFIADKVDYLDTKAPGGSNQE